MQFVSILSIKIKTIKTLDAIIFLMKLFFIVYIQYNIFMYTLKTQ